MPPSLLLDDSEILQVLASTGVCYAAFAADNMPYVLPLSFALTTDGCILLRLRSGGQAHGILLRQPQVCLAFSLLQQRCVDSVLLQGTAQLCDAQDGSIPVLIVPHQASGRRFPLHG